MKVKITGDAFVITSELTVENIQFLAKNVPDKLKVREKATDESEIGNEIFAVSYNESHPSLSNFGIAFGGKTRCEKGYATFTGTIPAGTENAKEFVADKIGAAATHLPSLEKSVSKAAESIKETRKKLIDSITED